MDFHKHLIGGILSVRIQDAIEALRAMDEAMEGFRESQEGVYYKNELLSSEENAVIFEFTAGGNQYCLQNVCEKYLDHCRKINEIVRRHI